MKTCWQRGLFLLIAMTVFLGATAVRADIEEDAKDFGYTKQQWHELNSSINKEFRDEAMMARRQKRASKYAGVAGLKYKEGRYMEFSDTLNPDSKGHRPFIQIVKGALIRMRIHNKGMGYDLDEQEQKLRDFWKEGHLPNRVGDFKLLYDRFVQDKRWKDAVRVAKECYEDYDWLWVRREWLDRMISCMWNDNAFHEEMYECINTFANDYVDQVGAQNYMHRYIDYLRRLERWDQAALLCNICVEVYKDCDWEPLFLQQAIDIHTTRWDVMKKEKAKEDAPAESEESNDDKKKGKKDKKEKKGKSRVDSAEPGHSGKLAFMYAVRMLKTYPCAPETDRGVSDFLKFVSSESKENEALGSKAAQICSAFLKANPESPAWGSVWSDISRLLPKDSPDQEVLDGMQNDIREKNNTRNEVMKEKIDADQSFPGQYLTEMKDFILANPDTTQARRCVDVMTKFIAKPEMIMLVEKNLPTIVDAISKGFSKSPAFRSIKLQALANCFGQPFVDFMYEDLIKETPSDLQKEYLYYRNAWRPTRKQSYDNKTFKAFVRKYEKSYYIPEVLYWVVYWAIYAENPQDAVKACEEIDDRRYARSLQVYGVLNACLHHHTHRAIARVVSMDPEKYGPHGKRTKKYEKLRDKYAKIADDLANLLDGELYKDMNMGGLYHSARTWGKEIRFRKQSKRTGVEVLSRKPYRETYLYYESGAWRLDAKKR